ncbi:hypothetical protein QUF55_07835 [Clostridiaceae bacterium HSG29]|nr:hypothetical protein [Clostridiaceae bacterium HSG29]
MKTRDLRIGNITENGVVKSFYESGIHVGFGKTYKFSNICPVKLTEEWLFKFGFEKISDINPPFRNYEFMYRKHGFLLGSDFLFHFMSGNSKIIHVHQLQNLYYTLFGVELEFTNISCT